MCKDSQCTMYSCCRETVSLCRNAHLPQYDRNSKYQWQCTLHLGKVHMESDSGHVLGGEHVSTMYTSVFQQCGTYQEQYTLFPFEQQ